MDNTTGDDRSAACGRNPKFHCATSGRVAAGHLPKVMANAATHEPEILLW